MNTAEQASAHLPDSLQRAVRLNGSRSREWWPRRVLRVIAVTFFALACNVIIGPAASLATQASERSPLGIPAGRHSDRYNPWHVHAGEGGSCGVTLKYEHVAAVSGGDSCRG